MTCPMSDTVPPMMGEASERKATSRRLSFKTRQSPRTYRSTKVTLTSNNVSLIASKFNSIIIEDDAKGRALLRKLSSAQHKPESAVKAAIQVFEKQEDASKSARKMPLVRKKSDKFESNEGDKEANQRLIFQRKPSIKAKPVLKNNNRQRYVSDLGPNFNQRTGKLVDLSINDKVRNRRSLGHDISQRIQQYVSVNSNNDSERFVKVGENQTLISENVEVQLLNGHGVKNMENKIKSENSDIRNKEPKVELINNVNRSMLKSSIATEKLKNNLETDVTKNIRNPVLPTENKDNEKLVVENIKEKTDNINKENSKPKLHPKPSLAKNQQKSILHNENLVGSNFKITKTPFILQDRSQKRLSIPKDPTILEHVLDTEPKSTKSTLIRPNDSFLWKSNSTLCVTEIPIIEVIENKSGNQKVPPPKMSNLNGFKTTEICVLNGHQTSERIGNQELRIKDKLTENYTVDKENIVNNVITTGLTMEKKDYMDEKFNGYETISNPDENIAQNKIPFKSELRNAKSNNDLQKLLVEEMVTRKHNPFFNTTKHKKKDITPEILPPALIRNKNTPPPVLRHLKKSNQSKANDVSGQHSDHYTLVVCDDESLKTYEDIGEEEEVTYAEILDYDDTLHNFYDDVLSMNGQSEDHYEAINPVVTNQLDSDSSCDLSNSLYGARPSSRSSSGGGVYQTSVSGQPIPSSETSDEWVDLDNSDDQNDKILVYREKDKPIRSWNSSGGWSQKVRRQWSKGVTNTEDGSDGSSAHPYEYVDEADDSTLCDDFDDSFDSDTSAEEAILMVPEGKNIQGKILPEPPREGIYGFMKQAGKKMKKHWSIGKSLRRIGKTSINAVEQIPHEQNQSPSNSGLNRKKWPSFRSKAKPHVFNQSTFYLNSTNIEKEKLPVPEATPNTEIQVDPRRLSTASMIRPSSPPPPPPPRRPTSDQTKKLSHLEDSFKKTPVQPEDPSKKTSLISSLTKELLSTFEKTDSNAAYAEGQQRLSQASNSNWYLDMSWPSTDTASEHGSSQGSDFQLTFADEPLYQFYTANVAEISISEINEDCDGYEEILPPVTRPSAMDLISPQNRTLWCEIPEVRNSGVFDQFSVSERRLQEAKFEVMTSEASYFKSLTVLDKHFASCPMFSDETILSSQDRKVLFGNVSSVRKCSEKLLSSLEKCWQNSMLLSGLCKILYDHVQNHFHIYVRYCSNQIYLDKTLKQLKLNNSNFSDILDQLEADPKCQSLTLHSFLMLPMQRVTRMPLLADAILSRLNSNDPEFSICELLLATLNKYVTECNEGARKQERYEEMLKLSQQLEFCKEVRTLPIMSTSRWLVRSGQLTQINMDAKLTFSRRLTRVGLKLTLFLFTDILVITKKKGEDNFLVIDYCQRNLVQMSEIKDSTGYNRHLLMVTLLENHELKTVELMLCCESETMRQRWLQAVSPPVSSDPNETLYEDWDCPQVSAIHEYVASQPDELSLQPGDVVKVFRKMADNWYYGERIRDGETGWFPVNHIVEIASMHVRAKNLKQRWRFLALSGNYVQEMQRKNKT